MKYGCPRLLFGAALSIIFAAAPAAYANSGQNTVSCGDGGTVTYSPTTLWPPNHKLQTINITYNQPCDEGCGSGMSVTVDQITESEEPPGNGCGPAQASDWGGVGNSGSSTEPGPATTTATVRAERCGTGDGRTYTIHVTCNDDGELSDADLVVTVPHNQ